VRFTITPLGAVGKPIEQIAAAIVEYLEPRQEPSAAHAANQAGTIRYYADRGSEPGRWLGRGALEAGLRGSVDSNDFARVLEGRDPRTGTRLLTAQGSAGRRGTLGVGTETRRTPDGEALYDSRDAAAVLDLTVADVERMLDAGARAQPDTLEGPVAPRSNPPGSYLVPTIAADGSRWVSETELARCESMRATGPDADAIAAGGNAGDRLPLAEAARLVGVTARYLRGRCAHYEQHHAEIETTLARGDQPAKAFVIGTRNARGAWEITRGELVSFAQRRRPPAIRVGYDITLTTEKSLAILALLSDDSVGRLVLDAIQAGNDVGIRFLETHAAAARAKREQVGVRGLTVASFQHLTSRASDPFPHHHNVVAAAVVDEHGTARALDARGFYRHLTTASALATAETRFLITTQARVRWRQARHGGWEIDGVSEPVLRHFSRRANDVEDAVRELEEALGRGSTLAEVRAIVLKTRPAKKHVETSVLASEWLRRAHELGFTRRQIRALVNRKDAASTDLPPREEIFAALAGAEGVCGGTSIFNRGDVIATLVDMPFRINGRVQPLIARADEFERLADEFLASPLIVELFPDEDVVDRVPARFRGESVYTTVELAGIQAAILNRYWQGLGGEFGRVPLDVVNANIELFRVDGDKPLSAEQQALVRSFCTSGQQVQCAIGRAGAGKTTTMKAAVAAWQAAGYTVVGSAVKGEAARILSDVAGISTETVAWYLTRCEAGRNPLDERTVLLVDEASTLSDGDLLDLVSHASARGTTVRLLGDPDQHTSVGAGGMFRVLCESHPERTPELAEMHRILDPNDAAAATALRLGQIETALAHLDSAGHLHEYGSEGETLLSMLERWWVARGSEEPNPMVERLNHNRRLLNRLARRLLQASGEIGTEEIAASGDRRFSVGDEVIARVGNRRLYPDGEPKSYLRNGSVGVIEEIVRSRRVNEDVLVIRFKKLGVIRVPRAFFDEHPVSGRTEVGVDHSYAVTNYAVEGATFGESLTHLRDDATRADAYVGATRGRTQNHVFLTRRPDDSEAETLPRLPQPKVRQAVERRLKASGPERTAVELDRSAGIHRPGTPLNLGELRQQPNPQAQRRSTRTRWRQIQRLAESLADSQLLERMPQRPDVPYLLHQWKYALGMVIAHRERWGVVVNEDQPWGWAVGALPTDADQLREREQLVTTLSAMFKACTTEALRGEGWADLPDWAECHVSHLAERGELSRPAVLGDLYHRISHYREQAQVTATPSDEPTLDELVLGPPPENHVLHARRVGLLHELQRPLVAGASLKVG
jgi:conjugative relaxase-like TrwC/TraI family protein